MAPFTDPIGETAPWKEVLKLADQAAAATSTVLITGETGTGKEVIANYIHSRSSRRSKAFVAVNCGAISKELFESEMFGIKPGTATGVDGKIGQIETAQGGTLLLDEIGDLLPEHQMKLLRALQEREFQRVGETFPRKFDVRFISATNINLDTRISEGRFRQDLLYRLNAIVITLPPLRKRRDDICVLADHFLKKHVKSRNLKIEGISPNAMTKLIGHEWRGNVRELKDKIETAADACTHAHLMPEDFRFSTSDTKVDVLSGDNREDQPRSSAPLSHSPPAEDSVATHQSLVDRVDEQFIMDFGGEFNDLCKDWKRLPNAQTKVLNERLRAFSAARLQTKFPRLKDVGALLSSAIRKNGQLASVASRAWTLTLQEFLENQASATRLRHQIEKAVASQTIQHDARTLVTHAPPTNSPPSVQPLILGLCGDLNPQDPDHEALLRRLMEAVLRLKNDSRIPALGICFIGGGSRDDFVDLGIQAISQYADILHEHGIALSATGIPATAPSVPLRRLDEPGSAWRRCSAIVSIGGESSWIHAHNRDAVTNPSRKPWLGLPGAGGHSSQLFKELTASIYGPTVAALSSWEINELETSLPDEESLASALHSLLLYRKPDEPLEADVDEFLEDIQRAEGDEHKRRALMISIARRSLRTMDSVDRVRAVSPTRLFWLAMLLALVGGLVIAATVLLYSPMFGRRTFLVMASQSDSVVHVMHNERTAKDPGDRDLATLLCDTGTYRGGEEDYTEANANTNLLMTKWKALEESRNMADCDSVRQYVLVDDAVGAVKAIRFYKVEGRVSVMALATTEVQAKRPKGYFLEKTDLGYVIVPSPTTTTPSGTVQTAADGSYDELVYIAGYPESSAGPASGWVVYPHGLIKEGDVALFFGRSGDSRYGYSDFVPARVLSKMQLVAEAFRLQRANTVPTKIVDDSAIGTEFKDLLMECSERISVSDAILSVYLVEAAGRGASAMWLTPAASLKSEPQFYYVFQYRRGKSVPDAPPPMWR